MIKKKEKKNLTVTITMKVMMSDSVGLHIANTAVADLGSAECGCIQGCTV